MTVQSTTQVRRNERLRRNMEARTEREIQRYGRCMGDIYGRRGFDDCGCDGNEREIVHEQYNTETSMKAENQERQRKKHHKS
jgi:hypothetical protein